LIVSDERFLFLFSNFDFSRYSCWNVWPIFKRQYHWSYLHSDQQWNAELQTARNGLISLDFVHTRSQRSQQGSMKITFYFSNKINVCVWKTIGNKLLLIKNGKNLSLFIISGTFDDALFARNIPKENWLILNKSYLFFV
jgi:hypothetical protein